MESVNKIIDPFLAWVGIITLALSAIDWGIGKDRRKMMREKMADWWIYLDDITYTGLTVRNCAKFQKILTIMLKHFLWFYPISLFLFIYFWYLFGNKLP